MDGAIKDKSGVTVHILEARFHHRGKSDEFVVVGRLFCCDPWVLLEVATGFQDDAIVSSPDRPGDGEPAARFRSTPGHRQPVLVLRLDRRNPESRRELKRLTKGMREPRP